jgi:hypothetical protein
LKGFQKGIWKFLKRKLVDDFKEQGCFEHGESREKMASAESEIQIIKCNECNAKFWNFERIKKRHQVGYRGNLLLFQGFVKDNVKKIQISVRFPIVTSRKIKI